MRELRNYIVLKKDGTTRLFGEIYNDPRNDGRNFIDGNFVLTNQVTSLTPELAMTESGSSYQLGTKLNEKRFCDFVIENRLESHGTFYCFQMMLIVIENHNCPSWFEKYVKDKLNIK
jgi:hypothetical protein